VAFDIDQMTINDKYKVEYVRWLIYKYSIVGLKGAMNEGTIDLVPSWHFAQTTRIDIYRFEPV